MRTALLLISMTIPAAGMSFPRAAQAPVDRLIRTTSEFLREHPNDAHAHYVLGRLHSYAFAEVYEAAIERSRDPRKMFQLLDQSDTGPARESRADLGQESRDHFYACLRAYRRAIELEPDDAVYHYSLAWMNQQGAAFSQELGRPAARFVDEALAEYRAAYRLASETELESAGGAEPFITAEAGERIIRILLDRFSPADRSSDAVVARSEVLSITNVLKDIRRKPGAITPVIFSLTPNTNLEDLLADYTVRFDLGGFGAGESWPWVKPDACILVWDPRHSGVITSGQQLFGSVTWSMFWNDGYEPLRALDDNGDGWLTGNELAGIGVWQDRNGNGISDPGEVTPAIEFGIEAIAVTHEMGRLSRRAGVKMKDDRLLTTFDWVPQTSAPQTN